MSPDVVLAILTTVLRYAPELAEAVDGVIKKLRSGQELSIEDAADILDKLEKRSAKIQSA